MQVLCENLFNFGFQRNLNNRICEQFFHRVPYKVVEKVPRYIRKLLITRGGLCSLLVQRMLFLKGNHTDFYYKRLKVWMISRVYSLYGWKRVANLAGHSRSVKSVAFNPKMPLLATGSKDKTAKLWRLSPDGLSAICMPYLMSHDSGVQSVAFDGTGNFLATGTTDGTVSIWRVSRCGLSVTRVANWKAHGNEVFSYAINSLAFHPTAPILATGSSDNTVKLWSLEDDFKKKCISTLRGHTGIIRSVAFYLKKNILATTSADQTVKLWSVSHEGYGFCVATLTGHSSWVNSVAFHPTIPLLATCSDDTTTKLWRLSPDGTAATCVKTIMGCNCAYSVAFHPSEPILATTHDNNTTRVYSFDPDGSTATCVATLAGHSDRVLSVAFDQSGHFCATSSEKTALVWRYL